MIWLFERNGESLRLETKYENDTAEFVLIVQARQGRPQIERFNDAVSFRERLEVLETQLLAAQWRQQGPMSLHDGWKLG